MKSSKSKKNSYYYYFFLYLIFLQISSSHCFDVPENLKDVCPKGCKRYFYCDEKQKKCVFKGFFPIYPLELLEIFILMISSSLATSCGIGGGTVYSSMILGVEELQPSEAFPISNFLILLCGLVTFISFTLDKYEHPKNVFVHYDLAVIFGPSMLIGAKFGTILNKVLSSSILLIFLLCLLIYTTRKTYYNILKARKKEAKLLEKQKIAEDNLSTNLLGAIKEMRESKEESIVDNNGNKLMSSIISKENYDNNNTDNNNNRNSLSGRKSQDRIEFSGLMKSIISQNTDGMDDNNIYGSTNSELLLTKRIFTDEDQKIINEDDDPLNWPRINFILLMEGIVIIDVLLEGSSKVPSFIGIRKCSFSYWLCFIVYICVALYFVKVAVKIVKEHIQKKKQLIPDYNSEVIENVEKNVYYVIGIAIFAGIVSSSLGIGGGMITNPVFAGLGMDPKQSSSSSNFLIIVTAIASSFIFILSGQLKIGYALSLGFLCTLAALIGSFFILKYINRTGRSSILLVIMEYFLIASFFIAIYKLLTLDVSKTGFIGSLFTTNSYC